VLSSVVAPIPLIAADSALPSAPTLLSPGNGTTVSGTSITYRWNASAGATNYYITVSTSSDPSDSSKWKISGLLGNVTQFTDKGYPNNGVRYYWWVSAGNSGGWSPQSEVRVNGYSFLNLTIGPSAPTLLSPGNGTTVSGTSVTYRWNASAGATKYYITVSASSDPSDSSKWKISGLLGNITQFIDKGYPDNGVTYYWWVSAGNSGGWSPQSEVRANGYSFMNLTVGPSAPTLASPGNGTTISGKSITYQWNASAGATNYYITVSTSPNPADKWKIKFSAILGNVTQYTDTNPPFNMIAYYWWVTAGNGGAWAPQSEVIANGFNFKYTGRGWNPGDPNYNANAKIYSGTIDISNLIFADFIGISDSQRNADLFANAECKGWDDIEGVTFPCADNMGDPNTNGDSLDGKIVVIGMGKDFIVGEDMQGWWDLGEPADKIAYFQSQDHDPYPGDAMDCKIYGSDTLWGTTLSSPAIVTDMYIDGWRPFNPAEDKNGNGFCSDDIALVFQLPAKYQYIKVVPWGACPYCDPEVDAIARFSSEPLALKKYVSVDNQATWEDANTAPGPSAQVGQNVYFKFYLRNTGNSTLSNIILIDSIYDLSSISPLVPDTLPVGGDYTGVIGPITATEGQHTDIGTVTAIYEGNAISDTDPANYFGGTVGPAEQPSIDVEKYVKDNTGAWQDADSATGPYIPSTQDPVVFKFTIENKGNVTLTGVELTDTDMTVFYTDEGCTVTATFPTTLGVGETKTYYGKLAWAAGQQEDEATAEGTPPVGSDVSDKDKAYYFGFEPSIDVEKYVKDNTGAWQDADSATGPYIPSTQDPVVFKFTIENEDDVVLSGVDLSDTDMAVFYTDEGCTVIATFPTTLAVGETKTYYGKLAWAVGQQEDEATAEGTPPVGSDVSDKDKAYYFGQEEYIGATRTPGFWRTHDDFTSHIFTQHLGGSIDLGWKQLTDVGEVFAMFWADKSQYEVDGTWFKRDRLCQARITGSYQLLAAILNEGIGTKAPGDLVSRMRDAMCNNDPDIILQLSGQLDAFNNSGDNNPIVGDYPIQPADPNGARQLAEGHYYITTCDTSCSDNGQPSMLVTSLQLNTPEGSDVTVDLPGAVIIFERVTAAGHTSLTTSQDNSGSLVSSGFYINGTFIDISTTATYSGTVTVGIRCKHSDISRAKNLNLYHWEGSHWDDITTYTDSTNNIVYGNVAHLSSFFVGSPESGDHISTIVYAGIAAAVVAGVLAYILRRRGFHNP
jgi:uncharacterized repeat protein (TIGR01451 family)